LDHLAQWEKEFSQFSNKDKQDDDGDLLEEKEHAAELDFDLNEYMKDVDAREWGGEEMMGQEKMRFGEDGFPVLGDYAFGESGVRVSVERPEGNRADSICGRKTW
jgi:hypothetical protein